MVGNPGWKVEVEHLRDPKIRWGKIGSPSTAVIRTPSTQRHNISYQVISAQIKTGFTRNMSEEDKEKIRKEWKRQIPLLNSLIDRLQPGEKGIIFIRYVEKVEWWASQLECPFIHGHVSTNDRNDRWDNWHNGFSPVIVTNKAGMEKVLVQYLWT